MGRRCCWPPGCGRRPRRPPREEPDEEEEERLNATVEAKIQASLESQSRRFARVHLGCLLGYVGLYLVGKFTYLQMNYVPVLTTGTAIAVHAAALVAHDVRHGRLAALSRQGGHTLAVCVNGLLSALANPEVQYYVHSTRAEPFIRPFGRRPLCPTCSGSIDGRCLMEAASADSVMAMLVTCSFFVVFVLDTQHALVAVAFVMLSYNAAWVWARLPWVLAFAPAHVFTFTLTCMLMGMMLAAKWKLEQLQRQLTVELVQRERQVVQEKVKRFEVEFKFETLACNEVAAPRGTGSVASSASPSSGGAFQGEWQQLASLGRREHWFIDVQDLRLQPGDVLGRGGFGVVLRGTFVGSPVAVKVARDWGAGSGRRELVNELRIFRHVRHPNIALFHGACFDPAADVMAVVLEFVPGTNLEVFISRGSIGEGAEGDAGRCAILLDICRALLYLHTREPCIVHGDVKPLNMMVEGGRDMQSRLRVKMLDFGLSRVLTPHAQGLGGTRAWMAPEVARSRRARPTSAADVYSFGRVAFFVATGRRPDAADVQPRRRGGSSRAPRLAWPPLRLPRRCQRLAERCLSQLPEGRPSAAQMYEDLTAWPQELGLLRAGEEGAAEARGLSWAEGLQQLQRAARGERKAQLLGQPAAAEEGEEEEEPGEAAAAAAEDGPPPPPEDDAVPAPDGVPGRCPTPRCTQRIMLWGTLLRWHCQEVTPGSCCAFHSSVKDIIELCDEMCSLRCEPALFRQAQEGCVQCPRCGALDDASASVGPPVCAVCGDPTAASSSAASLQALLALRRPEAPCTVIAL